MKVLLLGPVRPSLVTYLEGVGDHVTSTEALLTADAEVVRGMDFIISFGYRHLLRKDILSHFPRRAVNLHLSLLPWNRGADPNLWSFLEDSPKGVTVHFMDEGLDTGDIIAQKEMTIERGSTLRTSYAQLTAALEDLFQTIWQDLRLGKLSGKPQFSGGSYHKSADRGVFEPLLTKGWDTPVADLIGKALRSTGKLPR